MKKGGRMVWSLGILLGMGLLLSYPAGVRGDCLDLGQTTSWVVQDNHTVVCYVGARPLASLDVPDCDIFINAQQPSVPEPVSATLVGISVGALGLLVFRRRHA